jgi:hypothetical protein
MIEKGGFGRPFYFWGLSYWQISPPMQFPEQHGSVARKQICPEAMHGVGLPAGVWVAVAVAVDAGVPVRVGVRVGVAVVDVVGVRVGVLVGVGVTGVPVNVGVGVAGVPVRVGVAVPAGVPVETGVRVAVPVGAGQASTCFVIAPPADAVPLAKSTSTSGISITSPLHMRLGSALVRRAPDSPESALPLWFASSTNAKLAGCPSCWNSMSTENVQLPAFARLQTSVGVPPFDVKTQARTSASAC